MKTSQKRAGEPAETFSPHAQPFAVMTNSGERSRKSRRSRLALQAALARAGGFVVRFHRVISAFAASLIAFAPVHVLAQTPDDSVSVRDRARPEYDPLGARVGAFNLNARLDLSAASTDNLYADVSSNEADDLIYTASPWARLSSGWSRHYLSIEGGASFDRHADYPSEDTDTHFFRGVGRLDIGRSTSITGVAGVAHEVERRTDPDAVTTPGPIEYDRNEASVTVTHRLNRFRLVGEALRAEHDFDLQNFRDNEERVLRGRVEAEVTPRIGAVFQASFDERDYDNSPALSSEGQTYLAGVSINFTDLMEGEFTVGQFERDYEGVASSEGLAVAAELEWYVTRLTTLTFNARRNAEDVVGATLEPYVETEVGARVDHELRRNLILSGGFQTGRREFEGSAIDREDEFFSAQLGADYLMNRRVALRARYQHDEVDSSGANAYRDFEVNTVSVGLSLRL